MKKISITIGLVLSILITQSYGFWDKIAKQVNNPENISTLTSKLENVDIKNPADQQVWNNFVNDCIIKHVSTDKLLAIANSGPDGILEFLSTYKAPAKIMTTAYTKVISCPHALPLAQKIIGKVAI